MPIDEFVWFSCRLYMVQGEAAGYPGQTRVAECVCLHLFKEFGGHLNRPTGKKSGHKLGLPQSIVQVYSHIQQLVRDDADIKQHTNLASILLTVNTATVAKWLKKRQERIIPSTLVQGVTLPERVCIDKDRQQPALKLAAAHQTHEHTPLDFSEPENLEGQARKKGKASASKPSTTTSDGKASASKPSTTTSDEHVGNQSPHQYHYGFPGWGSWPYYYQLPSSPPSFRAWPQQPLPPFPAWAQQPPPPPTETPSNDHTSRTCTPHKKPRSGYKCSKCGEAKTKENKHAQLDGVWYCPSSGESIADWKDRVYKCDLCGLTPMSKANGHLRHKKKRREWYCPSSNQTVEEWMKSFDQ